MVDEIQLLKNSIRLMRKDELIVVPTMKISRSPQVHQRKLTEVRLTKRINKILSVVVENNCKWGCDGWFKFAFRFPGSGGEVKREHCDYHNQRKWV